MAATLTIIVGPPCSGKSTLAKVLAYEPATLRFNRDELRIMLKGRYVWNDKLVEACINKIQREIIPASLKGGIDVIVDATHCKESYINDIKKLVPEGSNVKVKYAVCDEPLWKLKLRNLWRYVRTGIWIPIEVIENMNKSFQVVKDKIERNEL